MTEPADTIITTGSPPQSESEESTILPTVTNPTSEEEASKVADLKDKAEAEKKPGGISLSIWPPTQKIRDAILNSLIETLSTESLLSKRYGTLKSEEAAVVAKSIEEEAYGIASSAVSSDDDGIKILEAYSKEISKRMLESVKARSNATARNGTEPTNESVEGAASEASNDDAAPESEEKAKA